MRVLLRLLLLRASFAWCWVAGEFPDPRRREWRSCGRSKPSFLCDPDFVLERGNAEKLDQIAHEFRTSTACPCAHCPDTFGIPVGVFIRHNLTQQSLLRYPGDGESLAEMLRKRWSLSPCDGDIVVAVVTTLNISAVSMGSAVQEVLPASTAARILTECRAHFDSGAYFQGLESVLNSLNDEIVRRQRAQPKSFRGLVTGIALGFAVLFVLAATAVVIVQRQARRRRKQHCDDIYDGLSARNNRRRGSFDREEHLEKLRQIEEGEEEEEEWEVEEEEGVRQPRSLLLSRLHRQLSDVAEEAEEERKSSNHVPVTEL